MVSRYNFHSFLRYTTQAFRRLPWLRGVCRKPNPPKFAGDPTTGIRRRVYETYEQYLGHQRSKLGRLHDSIAQSDREYEGIVIERYSQMRDWRGVSVLCLGARLGGEVRAFKELGALAIGIDIEPGQMNRHVLYGDFHQVQFPDGVFDAAFTNALDHVYELDTLISEVSRILKPSGRFYVELAQVTPGAYEAVDTSDVEPIISRLCGTFALQSRSTISNRTSFIAWEGVLLQLKRA